MKIGTPKTDNKLLYDSLMSRADLSVRKGNRCFGKIPDGPNEVSHIIITTAKKDVEIEVMVIHSQIVISVSTTKGDRSDEVHLDFVRKITDYLGIEGGYSPYTKDDEKNPRYYSENIIEEALDMKSILESWDELEDSGSTWKTTNFDKRISNICKIIEIAMSCVPYDTGLLDRFFVDPLTSRVAVNKKDEVLMWGEHIVPIDLLFRLSCEFIKQGGTALELEKLWEDNLKVLYISKELQETIDYKLKLQTTMPEGWELGDDPMARIVEGNNFLQETI